MKLWLRPYHARLIIASMYETAVITCVLQLFGSFALACAVSEIWDVNMNVGIMRKKYRLKKAPEPLLN